MSVAQTEPGTLDNVTDEQVESFRRDGFLIIEEGFLSEGAIEVLRERFAALFEGEYATGVAPDEVNWKKGRDPEDLTRQICNGWRSDDLIAAQVLSDRGVGLDSLKGLGLKLGRAFPDRGGLRLRQDLGHSAVVVRRFAHRGDCFRQRFRESLAAFISARGILGQAAVDD